MTDGVLVSGAINAALSKDWKEAIRLNLEIVKDDKTNIDALNRLGFAYLQNGNSASAKEYFNKVLAIDKYNQIAEKNLKKLVSAKKQPPGSSTTTKYSPLTFLEDPGKTKIINCLNVAPEKELSALVSGEEVYLKVKKHSIEIRDESDVYLGVLPDDIAFKLIKFIAGGNTYSAHVKSIGKNSLTVFLRELMRGKKFASQPSFTQSTSFATGSRVYTTTPDKPDMTATGEEPLQESED